MSHVKGMLNDFKAFLLRGNVVELAVAVVIGAAFTAIVNSMVKDIITPLIAAVGGQPDFSAWSITINGSQIMIGSFLNAVIAFVIVSAVIFFLVVKPLNLLMERMAAGKEEEPTPKDPELVLLEEIRDALVALKR